MEGLSRTGKVDPARSREMEFICGGAGRRWQPEVANFTPGLFASSFGKCKKGRRPAPRSKMMNAKKREPRGPRSWLRDCIGFFGEAFDIAPSGPEFGWGPASGKALRATEIGW